MSEYVDNVKKAVDLISRSAEALREMKPDVSEERQALADDLGATIDRLLELERLTSALPPDLGNIHDLPAELIKELSVAKTDEIDDQIVTVINAQGGEASLDQILVGLFRKFEVSQKRRFMQNKLYRMDTVWSVAGRKGIYTTIQPLVSDEAETDIDLFKESEISF